MSKPRTKVPVSMAALMARINRKLKSEGRILRKARGMIAKQEMGDYYILDLNRNALIALDIDPAKLATELGVLARYERVED